MDLRIGIVILCMIASVSSLGSTLLEGDVYIQFIGALYFESEPDGSCSSIDQETVQNMLAVKWTLSRLNEIGYLGFVRIGLHATHTCRTPDKDKLIALELATALRSNADKPIIGVIGPDYSSETESVSRMLSSLPAEYRLLQLGFSATSSSLRDRTTYKNFFRTIPPDDVQVNVMRQLITELRWTYMAILYSDDAYGRGGTEALIESTDGFDACFPARIAISPDVNTVEQLEVILMEKVLDAKVPISGILIFGGASLADNILTATETILNKSTDIEAPVFLFSEAGNTIVGQYSNISRGAYMISPRRAVITEYQEYWKGLFMDSTLSKLYEELPNNKWLKDVYETKFNCVLAANTFLNTCPPLSQDQVENELPMSVYTQYAIQAALVMSKVTKEILQEKCQSDSICSDFRNTNVTKRNEFIEKLSTMTISFDEDFDPLRLSNFKEVDLAIRFNESCEVNVLHNIPSYEVYNRRDDAMNSPTLFKVAEYHRDTGLEVNKAAIKDYDSNGNELSWPNIRKAQCPNGELCLQCLDDSVDNSALFIPGDMYVVGIVPVHNMGSTPLKCGTMKGEGVDIAEAIRFAVEEARVRPDASIGVIIIDSCNDPQIAQEKILTLHKFGLLINGAYIPVRNKILGYIGGWSSDVSKAIAAVTTRTEYVQISYASTAAVLSKHSLYPYFLRTPTPDNQQAEILLRIVREFKANLIQIVYSESEYGEGGKDILLTLIASEYREICVSQKVLLTADSDPAQIKQSLRNVPQAKIVLMFVSSFDVLKLLPELNTLDRNEFLFIATEGWGTRYDLTPYRNLIGTISVTSEITINEKFKDHMDKLSPENTDEDPWIRDYIELQFGCYFEWSFNKTSGKQCLGDERLDVYTTEYRIDSWTPFAERAVVSLIEVGKQVLEEKCGNSSVLCEEFRKDPVSFVDALKVYLYRMNTGSIRLYDDNGDGTAGYTIYTVALDQTGVYKKIGVQEPGAFTFQQGIYNVIRGEIINSSCTSGIQQCNICFPSPPTVSEASGLSSAVVAVIVLLGIICCVLAGILLFICNRNGCCIKLENGRLKLTSTYLTPVYIPDRNLHTIDGSDRNPRDSRDEHYDSIPHSSISYNRSNSSVSGGIRIPPSEGSSSSTDRGPSGGSSSGIMPRQNRYMEDPLKGRDNLAFDNEQRGVSESSGFGSERPGSGTGSHQSYLSANPGTPPPHAPPRQKTAAPPTPSQSVVYQADGSYITAVSGQDENKVSAGSQTELQMSASSDQSVGYLSKQKLAE